MPLEKGNYMVAKEVVDYVECKTGRKASKFLAGTEKDALIPLPVFSCSKCGHVNDEFLPEPLKKTAE